MRVLYSPLDVSINVIEATQGNRSALFATLLSVTPVNKVSGFVRKLTKIDGAVLAFSNAVQPAIRTILQGPFRIDRIKRAEMMLATGQISLADWEKLVDRALFIQNKKYSRAVARKLKQLDGGLRPPRTVLHHYLPLEFDQVFVRAGLDPNDPRFTAWVEIGKHMGWHSGPVAGGHFNYEWRRFINAPRTTPLTSRDIINEFNRITQKYTP